MGSGAGWVSRAVCEAAVESGGSDTVREADDSDGEFGIWKITSSAGQNATVVMAAV